LGFSLFAVRYSLFDIRYSLFAVRGSLVAGRWSRELRRVWVGTLGSNGVSLFDFGGDKWGQVFGFLFSGFGRRGEENCDAFCWVARFNGVRMFDKSWVGLGGPRGSLRVHFGFGAVFGGMQSGHIPLRESPCPMNLGPLVAAVNRPDYVGKVQTRPGVF
jgi:hypothetical protein